MDTDYQAIDCREIEGNPFRMIADQWMLVTAGSEESFNTMTASWGGFGELWHMKIAVCFVRPSRHTFGFMNDSPRFTLGFFGPEHREALKYCGTHSGREVDKVRMAGLTPFCPVEDAVCFEEARLIMVCRKVYTHDLDPDRFLDNSIMESYPDMQFHRMYIGEIEQVLRRE